MRLPSSAQSGKRSAIETRNYSDDFGHLLSTSSSSSAAAAWRLKRCYSRLWQVLIHRGFRHRDHQTYASHLGNRLRKQRGLYKSQGKRSAAMEDIQKAIKLDPHNLKYRETLCLLHREMGQYSQATAELLAAHEAFLSSETCTGGRRTKGKEHGSSGIGSIDWKQLSGSRHEAISYIFIHRTYFSNELCLIWQQGSGQQTERGAEWQQGPASGCAGQATRRESIGRGHHAHRGLHEDHQGTYIDRHGLVPIAKIELVFTAQIAVRLRLWS